MPWNYFPQAFAAAIEQGKKAAAGGYRFAVTAPCVNACPSSLDIPRYVEEISEQKFADSLATIRQSICMAGTLGRVCVRPCESNCRRANIDEAISIKYLKRFVADYEMEKTRHPEIDSALQKAGEKVAVIGAGPAGLSCAYYLALMGHQVDDLRETPRTGRHGGRGHPRLPSAPARPARAKWTSSRRPAWKSATASRWGKTITFADLRKDHDAVFIGVGAQGSSPMGVEGEDAGYRGFIPGVQYLLDINLGKDPYPEGKKVVVVGGGNVAIDCVRSSFRIGKEDVNLVYRRTKKEMPADPVEIHDAEEEKVKFHYLCNPTRIIAAGR